MHRTIFCTGFSIPKQFENDVITHMPLIEEVPLTLPKMDFSDATHIIFTSKTAVRYAHQNFVIDKNIPIISVGAATTQELQKIGFFNIYTAKEENAEGVVEILKKWPLTHAHYFWSKSALARDVIEKYFQANPHLQLTTINLYTVKTKKINPLPDWTLFDYVYFSSPSTIQAFYELYGRLPPKSQCLTIGNITELFLNFIK